MSDRADLNHPLGVGALDTRAIGWWAMIFLIFTEASLFGYLLFSYYYIAVQPHLPGTFPEGGLPVLKIAAPDTAILLLSSVAVAWAQLGIEHGNRLRLTLGLGIGAALGVVFIAVQGVEWHYKTFVLASSTYSSLFFTVTGFHLAHVAVGVIVLSTLAVWSAMGYFNPARYAHVHIGALYWHFVDAVWILVFTTFYLTPYMGLR